MEMLSFCQTFLKCLYLNYNFFNKWQFLDILKTIFFSTIIKVDFYSLHMVCCLFFNYPITSIKFLYFLHLITSTLKNIHSTSKGAHHKGRIGHNSLKKRRIIITVQYGTNKAKLWFSRCDQTKCFQVKGAAYNHQFNAAHSLTINMLEIHLVRVDYKSYWKTALNNIFIRTMLKGHSTMWTSSCLRPRFT